MSDTPIADRVVWRVRLDHAAFNVHPGHTVDEVARRYRVDVDALASAVSELRNPPGGSEGTKAYGRAMQERFRLVSSAADTSAVLDDLLSTWRAALTPAGFVEREEPGRNRWRRETTGLKMTLAVSMTTQRHIAEESTGYIAMGVRWSVSARDGTKWRRVEHTGRTLFTTEVSGDNWHLHDGIATTVRSGPDRDVLDELCSLGSTFAEFAAELSDRTTARRFVAALAYTRLVG